MVGVSLIVYRETVIKGFESKCLNFDESGLGNVNYGLGVLI